MKFSIACALALLVACETSAPRESTAPPPARGLAPTDELDRLDQRTPLPLLPLMADHQKRNMREHLAVVQQIVAATAVGDFSKVQSAAQRIGYSESMAQMCEHMGAPTPGFTEQALGFHHTADSIVSAAEQRDANAVLTALAETLATCTACHARYKQSIVAKL